MLDLQTNSKASSALADAGGSSRWERIAADLREAILEGRYAPGERLPNEQQLAQLFAVNRHTLRQAVQALAREGHVHVRQGLGTFVRDLVLDYALKRRTRLSQNLASVGERGRRELLAHECCAAASWADALHVDEGSSVALIRTRALVRGRPVGLTTAAFPLPRFAGIADAIGRHGSVTMAFAELGVDDYTRARSSVSARLPTELEADLLARSASQPVLVVQYVNRDVGGTAVEAGVTLFAADAVLLTIEPEA